MNITILVILLFLITLPLFAKHWKHLAIITLVFLGFEGLLFYLITQELADPNFNESAGTALVGIIPFIYLIMFAFFSIIRVVLWKTKKSVD